MPTQIDEIYNLGDDQLSNQFEVQFPLGIPFELLDKKSLSFRIDQPFDIPSIDTSEQELYFYGAKIFRPTRSDDTDKHITLSFRIDSKWAVFNALNRWHEKIFNRVTTLSGNFPISSNINSIPTVDYK